MEKGCFLHDLYSHLGYTTSNIVNRFHDFIITLNNLIFNQFL